MSSEPQKAIYSSSYDAETARLQIQADFKAENDRKMLIEVLGSMDAHRQINVLDLGCADGYLTTRVFSGLDERIEQVVGVDCEQGSIDKAVARNNEMFSFHCIDAESDDFDKQLDELMRELGIDGFDLIFTALALHHMNDRINVLRKLHARLSDGGAIYARGCDDGYIVAYPDTDGVVSEIVTGTQAVVSNDDRSHGRKLYGELVAVGFEDIRVTSYLDTTAGMSAEERYNLFEDNFAWRKEYYRTYIESSSDDNRARCELAELNKKFNAIEKMFADPLFFFSVGGFVAIGRK